MSPQRVWVRPDGPVRLLDWMVPLLPATRRVWGRAMRAELAGIEGSADRWRFAAGCALAILRRPAPGPLVSLAAPVATVAVAAVLSGRTTYLPLRIALVGMVAVLAAVYLVGVRSALLELSTDRPWPAVAVRVGGVLTLAWFALGFFLHDTDDGGDVVDHARSGVPIFTVLIGLYLLGFLAATSARLADPWVLAGGTALGVGAAMAWLVVALTRPPLPLSSGSAFLALGVAVLVGAVLGARRGVGRLTALCTTLVGALAIFILVDLALAIGPAAWVASDSAALTPAARLAQSRVEASESYLWFVLAGVVAAVAILGDAVLRRRRPEPAGIPALVTAEPVG